MIEDTGLNKCFVKALIENMCAPADPTPPPPTKVDLEMKIQQLLDGDPIGEKTAAY